jgi:5'-nucleotidase
VGSNMGEDITYSGTVAGAMEAVLQGVPAIAISQVFSDLCNNDPKDFDYDLAKSTIFDIVQKVLNGDFPLGQRKLLNINIPPVSKDKCEGIKITHSGHRHFGNDSHKYIDPKGKEFYWIGLHPLLWKPSEDKNSDFDAIDDNYVSITPIHLDMTSYDDINKLNNWIKKEN